MDPWTYINISPTEDKNTEGSNVTQKTDNIICLDSLKNRRIT